MPDLDDWKISVKSAVALVIAAGSIYLGYLRVSARVEAYEKTIAGLEAQVEKGNAKVAGLERAVIELTVELRTKGVIHAQ